VQSQEQFSLTVCAEMFINILTHIGNLPFCIHCFATDAFKFSLQCEVYDVHAMLHGICCSFNHDLFMNDQIVYLQGYAAIFLHTFVASCALNQEPQQVTQTFQKQFQY